MNFKSAIQILELDPIQVTLNSPNLEQLVKTQFKKLSLKYHPDKAKGDTDKITHYHEIARAHKYIIQKEYNQSQPQPQQFQTQTIPNINFNLFPPNTQQLFQQAFTTLPHTRQPDVYYTLDINTSELYHGCAKTIEVSRNIWNHQSNQFDVKQIKYTVKVIPGSHHSQQIVLQGGGHENSNQIISDLIVTLNEINDTQLIRSKQNLIYNVSVTLRDALLGGSLSFSHPSGKQMNVNYKLKSPYETITLQGSGMPIYGTRAYGDLKITFKVLFPTQIPTHLIEDADGILSALDYQI